MIKKYIYTSISTTIKLEDYFNVKQSRADNVLQNYFSNSPNIEITRNIREVCKQKNRKKYLIKSPEEK